MSVAVPVSLDRPFTYRVPAQWGAPPPPGTRVLVPFGPRALIGVVRPDDAPEAPDPKKVKCLHGVLDPDGPCLPPDVVALCEWMADYYLSPIGEVYRLALPGLLTAADARRAVITEAGLAAWKGADAPLLGGAPPPPLHRAAQRLLDVLADAGGEGLPVHKLPGHKPKIPGVLLRLVELETEGLVEVRWPEAGTKTRTELHVRRTDYLRGSAADEEAVQRIVGRSKQRRALLDYLEALEGDEAWVSLAELRGPFPRVRQLLLTLVDHRLVATEERSRSLDPFDAVGPASTTAQAPTDDQAAALKTLYEITDARRFAPVLLHGITGSGKTEVYLQHIARLRDQGRGAIVLVPEIALTPQLADRFRARFGDEIAVLHSALTPRQRLDAWEQIRRGERPIVIGARSAVFAPVPDLGTIVVDEEHDGSFKQEDGIRYHARGVALVRARTLGASVVLGSATPSLETFDNATKGRFVHLRMNTRPTPRPLPTVDIVPLSVHRPDGDSLMSALLKDAIRDTVDAGEQAIVFLNRRGYTTTLCCEECGSFQQCPDCSAPSMTYHLGRNRLMCHLCGYIEATPQNCRDCGSTKLVHGGAGTEKVEVALARSLEGIRVLRLDRDASRGKRLLDTLAAFRRREADVLVGTQMLSKGHDFPGVTLVGVLQADHGLGLPDLRASERTFQLLTQVAGRAGRGERPGRVIVQAYAIEHPAIRFAARHDFDGFAEQELERRDIMGNPPRGHLALIRVQGLDESRVQQRAKQLARFLEGGVGKLREKQRDPLGPPAATLLGPVPSPIAKINRRVRFQMLLRAPQRGALRWLLGHLRPHLGMAGSGAAQTFAIADVDPQTLL
ncbi:MAG: primosomal protein N' [Myxococcota bacterium]